jgi:hypothetical protein
MFMVQLLVKFKFSFKSLQILYECGRRAYHALLAQLFIKFCHCEKKMLLNVPIHVYGAAVGEI